MLNTAVGAVPAMRRRIGRYVIEEVLGQGANGVVYRAFDEIGRRAVALKTMSPAARGCETAVERFRREALCLTRCHAPHIATVYHVGTDDGVDYIAMELMAGTLQDRIAAGPASLLELVAVGAQVLMALVAAHRVGVIHRDVKPANIGLNSSGMVKLLDFGVADTRAWIPEPDDVSTGSTLREIVGSLPYMPPEQLRGESVDARSDIYGTGAVLYEYATGRRPFHDRSGVSLIDAVLNHRAAAPSTFNPAVGREMDRLILRAMAKKPGSRFPSAAAMMDALLCQLAEDASPSVMATAVVQLAVPAP